MYMYKCYINYKWKWMYYSWSYCACCSCRQRGLRTCVQLLHYCIIRRHFARLGETVRSHCLRAKCISAVVYGSLLRMSLHRVLFLIGRGTGFSACCWFGSQDASAFLADASQQLFLWNSVIVIAPRIDGCALWLHDACSAPKGFGNCLANLAANCLYSTATFCSAWFPE